MKTFNYSDISLTISGTNIKVKNSPRFYVLGDFNLRDIDEGLDLGVWNSLISKHLAHYSLSLTFLLIL